MDLITFGVFFFFFLLCVASVLLISVYGTSEQSFEDGLISKDGDKKKERKASGKKSDEAGTDASTVHQRKKPGKFGKKNTEEKESKPVETKPVEPVVAKAKVICISQLRIIIDDLWIITSHFLDLHIIIDVKCLSQR